MKQCLCPCWINKYCWTYIFHFKISIYYIRHPDDQLLFFCWTKTTNISKQLTFQNNKHFETIHVSKQRTFWNNKHFKTTNISKQTFQNNYHLLVWIIQLTQCTRDNLVLCMLDTLLQYFILLLIYIFLDGIYNVYLIPEVDHQFVEYNIFTMFSIIGQPMQHFIWYILKLFVVL